MTVWREIGVALIDEIDTGVLQPGVRLPSDEDLAARFGVNRHTVRKALTHLQSEGLLRSERGRGTFVSEDVISYRLAERTYFEENLEQRNQAASRTLLSVAELFASAQVARSLKIQPGEEVVLATSLGEADGIPVHMVQMYFSSRRLPCIAEAFRSHGTKATDQMSTTSVLESVGVDYFRRKNVRLRARLPTRQEAQKLKMPSTEPVIVTEIVNVGQDGTPVFFAITSFVSGRIEFTMEF